MTEMNSVGTLNPNQHDYRPVGPLTVKLFRFLATAFVAIAVIGNWHAFSLTYKFLGVVLLADILLTPIFYRVKEKRTGEKVGSLELTLNGYRWVMLLAMLLYRSH